MRKNEIRGFVLYEGPSKLDGEPIVAIATLKTENTKTGPTIQTWILKADKEGVLEQVLGQLDYNILSTLKLNGFERNEIITETWLRAYRAPFPTPASWWRRPMTGRRTKPRSLRRRHFAR